ncbi:hypothetical protein D3C87_1514680 [compost metagenome]
MAEKKCQSTNLHFEDGLSAIRDKGQVREDRIDFFGRAEKGETAAQREDRRGGEKCSPVLQSGEDLRIDHPQFTLQGIVDPAMPSLDHGLVEALSWKIFSSRTR